MTRVTRAAGGHVVSLQGSSIVEDVVQPSPLVREIVVGLWKIHILYHACKEGVVGNHMLEELREHGYSVSPGTLYPLLHRMERHGLIRAEEIGGAAHAARTYNITPKGQQTLDLLRGYVEELHTEVSKLCGKPERGVGRAGGAKAPR